MAITVGTVTYLGIGPTSASVSITAISYAAGLATLTGARHGFQTGHRVIVSGSTGVSGLNATWVITKVDENNFSLNGSNLSGTLAGTTIAVEELGGTFATGQPGQGSLTPAFVGTVQFTLDGTATTATVNYFDGTDTIGFTPSATAISRIVGAATDALNSIVLSVTAQDNKGFTVTFSAAGTNGHFLKILFSVYK